jgi:hypothetical protein
VRVLEQKMGPKSKEARHYHPARVAVGLTDQLSRITLDGGAEFDRETRAGQATWRDAEFHQEANLSDKPAHQVLVELKRGSGDMSQSAAWLQVPGARAAEAADPGRRPSRCSLARPPGVSSSASVSRTASPRSRTGTTRRCTSWCFRSLLPGYGERSSAEPPQCHRPGAFLAVQPNLPHYS